MNNNTNKDEQFKAAVKYSWAFKQYTLANRENDKEFTTANNRFRRAESVYRKIHDLTNSVDSNELWYHYRKNYCKSMDV